MWQNFHFIIPLFQQAFALGGRSVFFEIVINQLADVVESSVVGVPDEKWGEKVVAAVVTKTDSNVKPEEIRAHCKNNLHDWKCPKEVVFVRELPRNTMGKVLKEEVKNIF